MERIAGVVVQHDDNWYIVDESTEKQYFFFNEISKNHYRGLGSQETWKVVSADDEAEFFFIDGVQQNTTADAWVGPHFAPGTSVSFLPKGRDQLKLNDNGEILLKIYSNYSRNTSFAIGPGDEGVACAIVRA